MTSQPGIDGGSYNTSTQTNVYLDVAEVVESIPVSVYGLPTCGVSLLPASTAFCPLTHRSKCVSVPSCTWGPRSAALPAIIHVFASRRLSSRLSGTVWWVPVILWTKRKSQMTFSTNIVSNQAYSRRHHLQSRRQATSALLARNILGIGMTRWTISFLAHQQVWLCRSPRYYIVQCSTQFIGIYL
jgi:hypothetical protein